MAAQPRRMPNWAAFLLGVLTAVVVMAASFAVSDAWKASSSPVLALDLRLPTAPRLPDTPSLPPPPVPTPK